MKVSLKYKITSSVKNFLTLISILKLYFLQLCIPKKNKAMPKISNKGLQMPESPIRKLVPYAEGAKKEALKYTI